MENQWKAFILATEEASLVIKNIEEWKEFLHSGQEDPVRLKDYAYFGKRRLNDLVLSIFTLPTSYRGHERRFIDFMKMNGVNLDNHKGDRDYKSA